MKKTQYSLNDIYSFMYFTVKNSLHTVIKPKVWRKLVVDTQWCQDGAESQLHIITMEGGSIWDTDSRQPKLPLLWMALVCLAEHSMYRHIHGLHGCYTHTKTTGCQQYDLCIPDNRYEQIRFCQFLPTHNKMTNEYLNKGRVFIMYPLKNNRKYVLCSIYHK